MILVVCSTCRVRILPPVLVSAGTLHCWYCTAPPPSVEPQVIDWGEDEGDEEGDCDTPFLVEGEG